MPLVAWGDEGLEALVRNLGSSDVVGLRLHGAGVFNERSAGARSSIETRGYSIETHSEGDRKIRKIDSNLLFLLPLYAPLLYQRLINVWLSCRGVSITKYMVNYDVGIKSLVRPRGGTNEISLHNVLSKWWFGLYTDFDITDDKYIDITLQTLYYDVFVTLLRLFPTLLL